MKKLLCMVLAVVLLIGIVGCTPANNAPEDAYTDDGKMIIKVYGHDMDSLLSPSEDTAKILAVVEEKLGIHLEIETTTIANSPTLINQLIGGGDVPDMFIHFAEEPAYSGWLEAGYLMDYEPYLDDYPYLKNAFNALGTMEEVKSHLKGGLYSYPIIIHNEVVEDESYNGALTTELGMYYRRDWYQALVDKNYQPESGRALVDPEDPNFNYLNFYDLMEGYTRGDPDGNGKEDTYGYSLCKDAGVHWWFPLLNMYGVELNGWYLSEDGTWLPENTSDAMHDAVMWIAELYDQGFINPDYSTTTTFDAAKNNFINGKAGCMVSNVTWNMGWGILDMMESYIGKVANSEEMLDVVRCMPVVTNVNGEKMILGAVNNYAYMAINNDISEAKKQKILELLNFILSPEGDTLLTWGIEGDHYEALEDGSYNSLLPLDNKGRQKTLNDQTVAWGVYRLKGLASWETPFTNDPRPHPEATDQLMTAWDPQYMKIDELFFVTVSPSFATVQAELQDKTAVAFKQIVAKFSGTEAQKQAAREEIWEEFVKFYELKGSNYITAMNNAAKELYPNGVE